MQITTKKNERVTPLQMADAIINAEIQIDNPASSLQRKMTKALTGKEPRNVIECQMFSINEIQELAEHLLAYVNRCKREREEDEYQEEEL